MPPKKDAAFSDTITGFTVKETRLLAAAFVASSDANKIDYDLMGTLTGNTAGSLKKMFPDVKRKAAQLHPSFGPMVGISEDDAGKGATAKPAADKKAPAKANGGKKRKASDDGEDGSDGDGDVEAPSASEEKVKKKAPAKAKGRPKKAKKEEDEPEADDMDVDNEEEAPAKKEKAKPKAAKKGKKSVKDEDAEE